jgi:hypothetical protein
MIRGFAREWRLEDPSAASRWPAGADLITCARASRDYLNLNPPAKQVGHLRDVLQAMVESDARVTWHESVALEEIDGMLLGMSGRGHPAEMHEVLIVPQSDAPGGSGPRAAAGPRGENAARRARVLRGRLLSSRYAEFVCQKYIGLGLFSTVVAVDAAPPSRQASPALQASPA